MKVRQNMATGHAMATSHLPGMSEVNHIEFRALAYLDESFKQFEN